MKKSHALAFVPFLMASAALAEPATENGAKHLTQVFQTYLGATKGVVSVVANGAVYDLTLDVAPLMALAKDSGTSGSVTPLKMVLTDNGNGTWGVTQDQAVSVALTLPDGSDMKEDFASIKSEGTFDEALMTFSSLKGEFSGIKMTSTSKTPEGAVTAEMSLDKGTIDGTATAGVNGGVDSTTTIKFSGLSETISIPMAEGQPAMPITIKAAGLSEVAKGTGFMFDGIYKTVAWFVAHPDEAAMKADKAGLKTILTGAIPFFTNLDATGTVTKLTADTPMGPVGVDEMTFAADINGAVTDGKFREAFSLSGVTLPSGVVPAWAVPILPQKLSLDVQVTDFDAAAALITMLGVLDLPDGQKPGPEFDAALQAAALPKGTVTITLNPGAVTGDGYELTYAGSMVAGPQTTIPTGTAKVTLTGADKLQAALNAAPDDIKGQAMMGFGMAQGMAKQEDGKLVWAIDASTPGSVSVNGTPMMGGN